MILTISSCTSDDPSKGGLFGGLAGLGSGAYEQRVVDRTAALKAEEKRYQDAVAAKDTLDGRLEERREHAVFLRRQASLLENEIKTLQVEIETLQTEEKATNDQIASEEADVASILDDIDQVRSEQEVKNQAAWLEAETEQVVEERARDDESKKEVSELRAYILELQAAVEALKTVRDRYSRQPSIPDDN